MPKSLGTERDAGPGCFSFFREVSRVCHVKLVGKIRYGLCFLIMFLYIFEFTCNAQYAHSGIGGFCL